METLVIENDKLPNEQIQLAFDSTETDTFQLCPCKYNYRFNLQRTTATLAKPLDIGGLVHKGLEAYYKAIQVNKNFEEAVQLATNAVNLAYSDSDLSSPDFLIVQTTIDEYLNYWREEDKRFSIDMVEKQFIYPIFEDKDFRISMTGQVDLVTTDNRYFQLPVDHKTFSRDYPVRRLSNQFINYANACNSNFLLVNRIGLQKTLKASEKYKRIMLSYDPLLIEQWRQNMITIAMNYYDCVVTNNWPMNLTSCDKFNRLCEYYEVCDTSGNDNKVHKLYTNFRKADKWDISKPLEN
jgi:hypothetical protein